MFALSVPVRSISSTDHHTAHVMKTNTVVQSYPPAGQVMWRLVLFDMCLYAVDKTHMSFIL